MKRFKKTLFLFLLLIVTSAGTSQNEKLLAAFTKSHACEAKADYNGAIACIKEVYDKSSYDINLRLGWLHYSAGLYKDSQAYYQIATQLMPFSVEAKLGLVYPASALGNLNEVITQYKKILEIDSHNSNVNYRLGYIYYNKKDYAQARKYFERVVNMYPFSYDGLLMLGWTDLQAGKKSEAKILFNKVLLLSPSDKSALEGLSLIK